MEVGTHKTKMLEASTDVKVVALSELIYALPNQAEKVRV